MLAVIIVMLTATTARADDLPDKNTITVKLAPLKFKKSGATVTDEGENQELWSSLMKYKFWGTGEVVFDKSGVVIKEPSGYTGTAGKKIDLGGDQETSGAVVFNSNNYTLGGPIISGDDPQADKDLSVPELDESGITWESAVALTSAEAGEIQFIHVPPISDEDFKNEYLWFDKFIEGITFENGSGKTLYILMPTKKHNKDGRDGRLTRIFLRDGLTIKDAANDCKILVVYVNENATWNSTTNSWDGLDLSKATIIDDKNYEGNLLFYTNADITFGQMNSNNVLLGTYMTSGSLTVNNHLNIAGQLIAGKRLLFNDAYDGRFQYMPFNAVHIRPDIPNIKSDANGNCEFVLYMNDDALTEVSFDYSFDFLSSDDTGSRVTRDGMGDNPTDETDAHFMPFTQEGKTRHMVIPQGSRKSDKIYMNVKPNVYLTNEVYMFLRISNLHGAALYGTAKDGEILLKVKPYGNKPPYFIDLDKVILAVPENASKAVAGQVRAKDDEGDDYTYAITGGTANDLFEITDAGVVAMKSGVEPFDYEEWKEAGTKYTIVVDLCDRRATTYNTELCTQAKFTVSVIDENEAPYFTNQSDVILFADGAAVSTDAITFADPDKFATGEFLNNELVIMGDESNLFEITADGYIKPKDGAVIDKSEYEIEVRVRDANKDAEGNLIYPALYHDKTFTLRYYTTNVDYMDWDDTAKKLVKKNTATDDNDANDKVWILDGTESTLPSGWYIARGNVSYSSPLFLKGDVHVILTDGAMMKNQIETLRQSEILTIHGQTEGTGKLTGNRLDIDGDITINGGIIEINSERVAISSIGNIFINGGQVTAAGRDYGIQIESFLNSANRYIILRWSKISDFIQASSYYFQQSGSVMKIPAGKCFLVDGTTTVFGSATADYVFTDEELTAIAGKKLIPALPIATGGYAFVAFSDDLGCWKPLGDDVQVYVVTGYDLDKGKVYLKAVEGNAIPKGMPVVIGNKTEGAALPTDFFLVGSDTQTTIEGELKNFVSCDGSKTVQDYLNALFGEGASASEYIAYVITGGTFTSVEVKASDVIKKGFCLLFISKWDVLKRKSAGTSNATTRTIGIGDGEATGIREVTLRQAQGPSDDAWYLLDGRKLSGQPTKKGIYIYKGKKVKR